MYDTKVADLGKYQGGTESCFTFGAGVSSAAEACGRNGSASADWPRTAPTNGSAGSSSKREITSDAVMLSSVLSVLVLCVRFFDARAKKSVLVKHVWPVFMHGN
jgi:hypothetical protein